jgi:hypothetical protein
MQRNLLCTELGPLGRPAPAAAAPPANHAPSHRPARRAAEPAACPMAAQPGQRPCEAALSGLRRRPQACSLLSSASPRRPPTRFRRTLPLATRLAADWMVDCMSSSSVICGVPGAPARRARAGRGRLTAYRRARSCPYDSWVRSEGTGGTPCAYMHTPQAADACSMDA